MKKVLVLGATGGMGYSVVNELMKNGFEVIAFGRNKQKLEQLYHPNPLLSFYIGDAYNLEQLLDAAKDVDTIFHSISVPYEQWTTQHPQLMKNVLDTAASVCAKVVIVDNIYAYGKDSLIIKETSPKKPHTKKGKIRLQLEQMAEHYQNQGVDVLFAHFPDFYGPNAYNTYIHTTLSAMIANKKPVFVGPLDVEREFIYTPDGAKALVQLAKKNDAYNQHWNIPGNTITGRKLIQIAAKLTNNYKKPTSIKKWMIALLGLVNPFMKELVEMQYLTEKTFRLDGTKFTKEIGVLPKTTYEEGIKKTLRWLTEKN